MRTEVPGLETCDFLSVVQVGMFVSRDFYSHCNLMLRQGQRWAARLMGRRPTTLNREQRTLAEVSFDGNSFTEKTQALKARIRLKPMTRGAMRLVYNFFDDKAWIHEKGQTAQGQPCEVWSTDGITWKVSNTATNTTEQQQKHRADPPSRTSTTPP